MGWGEIARDAPAKHLHAELQDLASRLRDKASAIDGMAAEARANDEGPASVARLRGKAEGVRLALSFVEELHRA